MEGISKMASAAKRPNGITAIAILLLLNGIFLVYVNSLSTSAYAGRLSILSQGDPWFQTGIPVLLALSVTFLLVGILQLVDAYGFLTGKSFSYRFALIVPLILTIVSLIAAGVALSAPTNLNVPSFAYWVYLGIGIFWLLVYFLYLTKPGAKAYLNVASDLKIKKAPVQAVSTEYVVIKQGKFYCRYCGTENPKDTVFCESCGKQLR